MDDDQDVNNGSNVTDTNILQFPQSRCRKSNQGFNHHGINFHDAHLREYLHDKPYALEHDLRESELFLANLLHNIAEQYQLDPYYAAQSISPFIPGLHSLVETVLNYCDSPYCDKEHIEIINQLLAETLVNSFQHAQNLAGE